MTREQARMELMQIYGSLSSSKQIAIDTLLSDSENPNKSEIPTSCDDAISRAEAQTAIMMSKSIVAFDGDLWIKTKDAVQIIRELPSVQPSRKGHWIRIGDYHMEKFECSECHTQGYVDTCMYEPIWEYCPSCGADMRGAE